MNNNDNLLILLLTGKTDDLGKNVQVKVTQETFMNIEGLKKYINYSFYIRSWGAHRCSLPSNTVTCKISDHCKYFF